MQPRPTRPRPQALHSQRTQLQPNHWPHSYYLALPSALPFSADNSWSFCVMPKYHIFLGFGRGKHWGDGRPEEQDCRAFRFIFLLLILLRTLTGWRGLGRIQGSTNGMRLQRLTPGGHCSSRPPAGLLQLCSEQYMRQPLSQVSASREALPPLQLCPVHTNPCTYHEVFGSLFFPLPGVKSESTGWSPVTVNLMMSLTGTGGGTKGVSGNSRNWDAGQVSIGTLIHSTTLVTTG